ncbi:MAG: 2Fe-2S iron-sulfur cluster-binding protein [Acidimicrobiales bacterium]|nr:2Fe-2S iron-sulfur cluster-binding protein [Acidimicrobiales bacterium]
MTTGPRPTLQLEVDGQQVEVADRGVSLLDVLREDLGLRSPKDGCSPQGQCGCCTVLVDGQPRVACVTPARRVAGRAVTTVDGLDEPLRSRWADALCATGGSQCGFCTPGIVCRLEGLRATGAAAGPEGHAAVEHALLAHLCRCTGWRTILDAWDIVTGAAPVAVRTSVGAAARAALEGGTPQAVEPAIALGRGGFADDTAPADALVAVLDGRGDWAVGASLAEARAIAGKVQGRRTTVDATPPLEVPPGEWAATLRTSWVEPAYLEPDASWCEPGAEPHTPLANGGAFGGKEASVVAAAARTLADRHGRPVRVLLGREDIVRFGPKRPPVAAGARPDGSGALRVVRTPGVAEAIASVAPSLVVEEVDRIGPPTSASLRAAGWAEAVVLLAGARGSAAPVVDPHSGAVAEAEITASGEVRVRVRAGDVLDEVVLRSYCTGAAHMALSWMSSEGIAVDDAGEVHDLTIRSFGVLRAVDTPAISVEVERGDGPPVRGSDAVFAAVAAAAWLHEGCTPDWPTGARWR